MKRLESDKSHSRRIDPRASRKVANVQAMAAFMSVQNQPRRRQRP